MKKLFPLLFLMLITFSSGAQSLNVDPHYQFIQSANFVQSKNYYLLTLFEQDKAVSAILKKDEVLLKLAQQKLQDLNSSLAECKDALCLIQKAKFSDTEIATVSARLRALYQPGSALDLLTKTQLIPSGTYILNKGADAADLLVKAWEQDAAGINYTIGVYAEGKKPNYPLIDSISFNTKHKRYYTLMYDCAATLAGDVKNTQLFFEPAMQAALLYLQINERTDAANYEPMALTVNKAAADRVKLINWSKYPYSNILVPGAGGEDYTSPLSAEGMLRCRLAAQKYQSGAAPFIMVSGGKVHPYKVKFCEAEEMKRYLMNTLHIPESAIIMDPHARHTTTNLRNCVRLIYRYGIPYNKPGLIITDKSQTDAIMVMAARCEKELKCVPYKLGKRNAETEVEYYPAIEALQINPYEPLDP
ncbi:YdcF family protein [Mucilaginibacter paludis]|uniref:DUF218 domain-containing protein n=1 Tax=Mucilaginibacter paludis DSM 18603 TaxID=714943 RepID=H1Y5V0_9SPHI|nr:YdcF family protein [Mucilaginibacter paludis]EHQ30372.1 protein of unknown function DUF218 [Mucilaginibacter paludis DSM 18603]